MEKIGEVSKIKRAEKEPSEKKEPMEVLSPRTLAFLKEHIDVASLAGVNPSREIAIIKDLLKKLPREEQSKGRRILMGDLREKIWTFRENLAKAQLELEQFLRSISGFGPERLNSLEKSKEKALEKINKILTKYDLDGSPLKLYLAFTEAVGKFFEARKTILETAKKYQDKFGRSWQEEFFKNLFGRLPSGPIEIQIFPMSFYLRIHDFADYALAFSYMAIKDEEAEKRLKKQAENTGGVLLHMVPTMPILSGKILIENSSDTSAAFQKRTKIHEEEHAIHRIYPTKSFVCLENKEGILFNYSSETISPSELKRRLKMIGNRVFGREWEFQSKTEALANFKDGRSPIEILNLFWNEDGMYNFLKNWDNEQEFIEGVAGHYDSDMNIKLIESGQIILLDKNILTKEAQKAIKEVWLEYLELVKKSIIAMDVLMQKYDEDRNMVLRILSQEPLSKWPRLTRGFSQKPELNSISARSNL